MTPAFAITSLPRRAVMGIVNVTPDSFSDGGRFFAAPDAVAHGLALANAGAAVLDVGGESTRPGAEPVGVDEELRRVVPVVRALSAATPVPVSIDTSKAAVADAALAAGARIVNDVSAGEHDPEMLSTVAGHRAGFVAMHKRGSPPTMQDSPAYDDVVAEVGAYLRARVDAAIEAGIAAAAVFVDPGIGFGKTITHNVALLGALGRLAIEAGAPLLVGTSRKTFLGTLGAGASPLGEEPADRDDATLATTVWCFQRGVTMVRVHDVDASVRAAALLDVMERATPTGMRVA